MTALRLRSVVDITPPTLPPPSSTTRNTGKNDALPRLLIPRGKEQQHDVCIEAVVKQRKDGRYQLVIQSGPDQVPAEIHATYLLPADAYFPLWHDSDNHVNNTVVTPKIAFQDPYIAILIHPHGLVLHEINPTNETPSSIWTAGEGWTVSLPMETDAVWAHPSPQKGWILQRVAMPPPVLQLPPHVRETSTTPMRWFSLEHVWEDPLPVRLQVETGTTTAAAYDWEQEHLVWVRCNHNVQWVLTYHETEQRHTLWTMEEERGQPMSSPLYEQTRGRQGVSDVSILWGDLDEEQQQQSQPGDTPPLTRQEALAQALRVGGSSSHQKAPAHKRPRPSAAAFAPLAEEQEQQQLHSMESLSPLIYPRWSWKPVAQQVAQQAAECVWILTGDDDTKTSLLALLVPDRHGGGYEIQYWPLTDTTSTSKSAVNLPSLACRGARPVEAVSGRTDLLVWTSDDQLVLYRSGQEAMLHVQCPGQLASLSDALGSRVSIGFTDGRLLRASIALTVSSPAWVERLFQMLETSTPLVWALRLDYVRLQDLLLTKNPDTPKTAALEVLLEILMELDWQKGQSSPPSAAPPEKDSWNILLESDFHRDFSTAFEDLLFLGEKAPVKRTQTSSWMRQTYLENHPLLFQAWKSELHQGTLATVFDALHLLWQDTLLYVQQRPLELLELLVKIVRTVLLVNPSNALAPEFAEEYLICGGSMPAVTPLQLDSVKIIHAKFTNFDEW